MTPLRPNYQWIDDPRDPNYNHLAQAPYPAHAEALWRSDGVYDIIVVVGYNMSPTVPGAGSAIFLHIAREDYAPTKGCVALARDDLLELVTLIGPETRLNVLSTTAADNAPPSDGEQDMKLLEDFDEKDW